MIKKNRSQGNNISEPKSRQTQNTEYKKCLSMLLFICIKQHLPFVSMKEL